MRCGTGVPGEGMLRIRVSRVIGVFNPPALDRFMLKTVICTWVYGVVRVIYVFFYLWFLFLFLFFFSVTTVITTSTTAATFFWFSPLSFFYYYIFILLLFLSSVTTTTTILLFLSIFSLIFLLFLHVYLSPFLWLLLLLLLPLHFHFYFLPLSFSYFLILLLLFVFSFRWICVAKKTRQSNSFLLLSFLSQDTFSSFKKGRKTKEKRWYKTPMPRTWRPFFSLFAGTRIGSWLQVTPILSALLLASAAHCLLL